MTNIIDNIISLYPLSEDTIQALKECMTLCRFPKKYQLIKGGVSVSYTHLTLPTIYSV